MPIILQFFAVRRRRSEHLAKDMCSCALSLRETCTLGQCGCLFGFASKRVKKSKRMYRAHMLGRLILNLMTLTCSTPRTDLPSLYTVRTVTRTSNSRVYTKPPRGALWKLAGHLAVHMSGIETVRTCIGFDHSLHRGF